MPEFFFAVSLFGPLVAGLFALIGGKTKAANTAVQTIFAVSGLLGLIGSIVSWASFTSLKWQPIPYAFASFSGGVFQLDGWASFFLGLINLGILLSSLFAIGYLPRYLNTYRLPELNFVSGLFIFGMQAVVLSSTVFAFLLFWEIMSLAAYFLVIADREEASLKAGLLYIVMTHIGAACLLVAMAILSKGDVLASFADLARNAAGMPLTSLAIAFFLLFIGFGSKAGLVPLHQWLPFAHPQAPSHSSALMSGVMLKVAVYGFLRFALSVFPAIPLSWAIVVVVIGLLSALFGVLYAAVETDLKRLLAWSSVENLGLVFAMIGMGLVFTALHLPSTPFFVAAMIHALNHTIFKSGLFLGAGAIISETHTRNLDELGGLAQKWPAFSGWFLALCLAASALPPLGTFYGEWVFLQHLAYAIGQTSGVTSLLFALVLSIVALVGGLAIFTFAKTFAAAFLSRARSEHAEHVKPLPFLLVAPLAVCAFLSVVVGLAAVILRQQIATLFSPMFLGALPSVGTTLNSAGGRISAGIVLLLVIVIGIVVTLLRRLFTSNRPVRITDTWDCGQPITARMHYTATGFAAPIRFFFRTVLLSRKKMIVEPVSAENPWIATRRLESGTSSIWERMFYQPMTAIVLWISSIVTRLQSGIVQFYILLIFVTLVLVLLFAL